MSVFQQLLPASFKNVSFLVPSENKTSGKKTIDHEYPNSDDRFIEELGRKSSVFQIPAIITGSDAIQKRIRLEKVLNDPGRGLLIHPSLGQIMVVSTDFDSSSSDTKLGEFQFNITFKESVENISLTDIGSNPQLISSLVKDGQGFLDASFVKKFINTKFPDTIFKTSNQLIDVSNTVSKFTAGVSDLIPTEASSFNSIIDKAVNSSLITSRNGANIATQIRDIYNAGENISRNISSFFNSWKTLTSFGDDRLTKQLITQKRITEENNLSSFEDHTKLNALLGLYESASYTDFQTDEELLSVQNTLESQYELLVDNSDKDSLASSADFRETIASIRVKTREILEEKALNVWSVVDIEQGESSIALTSYRYYGSIDNLNTIKELNPTVNVAMSEENIKALS